MGAEVSSGSLISNAWSSRKMQRWCLERLLQVGFTIKSLFLCNYLYGRSPQNSSLGRPSQYENVVHQIDSPTRLLTHSEVAQESNTCAVSPRNKWSYGLYSFLLSDYDDRDLWIFALTLFSFLCLVWYWLGFAWSCVWFTAVMANICVGMQ